MKTVYSTALGILVMMPLLVQAQLVNGGNDKKAIQEIVDFRNRYIEAEENKDTAYLYKVLADDFYALNPQGQLLDKSQHLANIKRSDRIFKVLNPRDTQVHFYDNGNVAILSEHVTVEGDDNGHHFGGEFRFARVFIRQHGQWQVALAQGAAIPSPLAHPK